MTRRRPSLVAAACVASLLVLLAGCDKDKKGVEPPAELVDLKPTLAVQKLWDTGVGGGGEKLRLALGLALERRRALHGGARRRSGRARPGHGSREAGRTDTKADLAAGPGVGASVVAVGTSDGKVDRARRRVGQAAVEGHGQQRSARRPARHGRSRHRALGRRPRCTRSTRRRASRSGPVEEPVPKLSLRGTASPVLAGTTCVAGFDSGKVIAFALAIGRHRLAGAGHDAGRPLGTRASRRRRQRRAGRRQRRLRRRLPGPRRHARARLRPDLVEPRPVELPRPRARRRPALRRRPSDGSVVALRRRDGTRRLAAGRPQAARPRARRPSSATRSSSATSTATCTGSTATRASSSRASARAATRISSGAGRGRTTACS